MDARDGFSGLRARKGRPLLDRLMERTIPVPWSGCWLWTGGLYVNDYGMAFLPGGKPVLAHRAMMIAQGHDLSPHDVVRHRCDVPMCINPEHLVIGTQRENMADMHGRGRHRPAYAIQPEWRARIRADNHTPAWAVAAWFGVSLKTVRNIRSGK